MEGNFIHMQAHTGWHDVRKSLAARPRSPDISTAGKNGECRLRRRNGITRQKMPRMMHAATPCLTPNLQPPYTCRRCTFLLPLFIFPTFYLSPLCDLRDRSTFRSRVEREELDGRGGGQVNSRLRRQHQRRGRGVGRKKHSRLWDSITTTSRVIYIDIYIYKQGAQFRCTFPRFFRPPLSLSLSLFSPGRLLPAKMKVIITERSA